MGALASNPAKLLAFFARTLNADDFSAVKQTMTAVVKKLLEAGRILSGPNGSLKPATSASA